jgi:hypothetical protein
LVLSRASSGEANDNECRASPAKTPIQRNLRGFIRQSATISNNHVGLHPRQARIQPNLRSFGEANPRA